MIRLLILFIILFPVITNAATVNVADYGDNSMSVTNFESAYAAADPGDTILFDGSNATWTGGTTIGKPVIIDGNGSTLTTSTYMATGFFNVTGFEANSLFRLTGFILDMTDNTTFYGIYVHAMVGGVASGEIRIDNNTIHHGGNQIEFEHSKGLIDHNTFYNGIKAIQMSSGSRANADESWESMAAGTANAIFVEDNSFIRDNDYSLIGSQEQVGTKQGGKLVVRYNTFDATAYTGAYDFLPIMTHGSADGGCSTPPIGYWQYDADSTLCRRRGQSVVEVYSNTFAGDDIPYMAQFRGSVNLVYDNACTGATSPDILLREEEYQSSNWTVKRLEWPAEDQVHNTFIWDNTYGGSPHFNAPAHFTIAPKGDEECVGAGDPWACCPSSCGDDHGTGNVFIQLNRDFFMHEPATTGSGETLGIETFTASKGAAGSHPTDGDPYPTKGTMQFTAAVENAYYGYTPYTYPHPLQSGSGAPSGEPITGGFTESDIVAGATYYIDVENTEFVATAGDDNAITTAIIAGIIALTSQTNGYNNEVTLTHANITRLTATRLQVDIPATGTYNIAEAEYLEITLPETATDSPAEIVCSPTIQISPVAIDVETPSGAYNAQAGGMDYNSQAGGWAVP